MRKCLATVVAALLSMAGVVLGVAAPAHAAAGGLKITSVEPSCECGGEPLTGSGAYLLWGFGATAVNFTDPTPAKGHTYKLVVSPRVKAPKKGFQMYLSGKKGDFVLFQSQAKLKLGTKYTFKVQEYAGKSLVDTSAPVSWTPKTTKAPASMAIDSQTMPNGVEAFVAGTTYHLTWPEGAWEKGAKVTMQALVFDSTGAAVKAVVGKNQFNHGATVSPKGVSFTPTAGMAGKWIGISVYGQKKGKLPWGWSTEWIPVIADASSTAQWYLGRDKTGSGSIEGPAELVTGAVLTAATNVPETSADLGITATYQWYRETYDDDWNPIDTDIDGATGDSYTVTADDAGAALFVRVTYTSSDPTYASSTESVWAGSVEEPDGR